MYRATERARACLPRPRGCFYGRASGHKAVGMSNERRSDRAKKKVGFLPGASTDATIKLGLVLMVESRFSISKVHFFVHGETKPHFKQ
jgi:hypothetical protein